MVAVEEGFENGGAEVGDFAVGADAGDDGAGEGGRIRSAGENGAEERAGEQRGNVFRFAAGLAEELPRGRELGVVRAGRMDDAKRVVVVAQVIDEGAERAGVPEADGETCLIG